MADIGDVKKQIDALTKSLPEKEAKKLGEILKKALDSSSKSAEKASKSFGLLGKSIEKTEEQLKDMDDVINKLSFEKKLNPEDAIKLKKELIGLKKEAVKLSKTKIVNPEQLAEAADKFDELQKKISETTREMTIMNAKSIDGFYKMGEGAQSFGDMFGSIWKKSPAGLKRSAAEAGDVSKKLVGWGENLRGAQGAMGMMGGAARGLGKSLGGVTKILGGWPGLILMAVKAAVDFVLDADQFVKDQNKIFAQMRGPDIMTGDVEKQFKQFNDQIFKASENIKVGFNAKSIQEFFNAVNQAGLNITTLARGINDYRDAVYIAAKASKTLGMDLPYIGAQMSDLITNFKANLREVDEAFVQVAFDAGKSGLATDRFWTAIKNATAGMAMYGLFIKSAAKVMKAFSESQVMGAEDAAKATDEMYNVFKQGSLKSKMAVVQFAGGISDAFKEKVKELQTGEMAIKGKIQMEEAKGGDASTAELSKLRKELAANQAQQDRAQMAANGDQLAQVNELAQISDKAPEITARALEKLVGRPLAKISGESFTVLTQAADKIGISADLAVKMVNVAKASGKELDNLSESLDYGLQNLTADQGERLEEISRVDTRVADALQKGDIPLLKKLLKEGSVRKGVEKANFQTDQVSQDVMAAAAQDTFEEVNKQTLSYKEMIDIAKDEVKWRAMSLGIFRALNTGVNDIIGIIGKGQVTESQKLANQQLRETIYGNEELAKIAQFEKGGDKKGMLTEKSQLEITQKVMSNIDKLSQELAASKLAAGGLKEASGKSTRNEQMAVIQSQIDKFQKQAKKLDKTDVKAAAATRLAIEKMKKVNEQSLDEVIKQNDTDLERSTENLATQKSALSNLEDLNKGNKDLVEIQSLIAQADPKAMKLLADKIEGQGGKAGEMIDKYGISLESLRGGMEEGIKEGKKYRNAAAAAETRAKQQFAQSGGKDSSKQALVTGFHDIKKRATLSSPEIVTSPGIVNLDPGEMILPKETSFKTIPATVPGGGPAAPMGGAAGGKNISITVNATEKDLASKIANEVRAVLYKESVI